MSAIKSLIRKSGVLSNENTTLIFYLLFYTGVISEYVGDSIKINPNYKTIIIIFLVMGVIPIILQFIVYDEKNSLYSNLFDILSLIYLVIGLLLINAGYLNGCGQPLPYNFFYTLSNYTPNNPNKINFYYNNWTINGSV